MVVRVCDSVPVVWVTYWCLSPGGEQLLFVRLFLRKHQWLRASKLSYPDIAPSLTPLLYALVHNGLLTDGKYCNSIYTIMCLQKRCNILAVLWGLHDVCQLRVHKSIIIVKVVMIRLV